MENKPANPVGLTKRLAQFIATTSSQDIPPHIFEHAKTAFMDWVAVAIAGKNDPLVRKLLDLFILMGGHEQASILGHNIKATAEYAALINGAASHSLDYDDTLKAYDAYIGHPSVTLFPALLALSEWRKFSGIDFLTAYIIGFKVTAVVGGCAGISHYLKGSHSTSTIGYFGSAAACAKLLSLNEMATVNALGIAGTQASGLKRIFGTMCKPLHAGKASQAGLISSLLASDGFSSADNIIEGPQGFFDVLQGETKESIVSTLGKTWNIEELAPKFHASCHATHASIEAVRSLITDHGIEASDIKCIGVYISKLAADIAANVHPQSGFEGKFSIPFCIATAILNNNTGPSGFEDEVVNDRLICSLMAKITLYEDQKYKYLESRVEIEINKGRRFIRAHDVFKDIPEPIRKRERMIDKFTELCLPVLGKERMEALLCHILNLERIDDMSKITDVIG